jgi:hypothetical protein
MSQAMGFPGHGCELPHLPPHEAILAMYFSRVMKYLLNSIEASPLLIAVSDKHRNHNRHHAGKSVSDM